MTFRVLKRGTLLIPSGTLHDLERKHLFVICTDACTNGNHLRVPIASWLNDLCDPTCQLTTGEHRFITHPSYVLYRKSRINPATALVTGVQEKILVPLEPMNGQTFLRIAKGVCRSPHTPRKIRVYASCSMD